ncbi:MAG: PAS domain S-box protein [Deltaproteobacteria bacterium]|nr:PAS domain S-box protein [Deltaproteobacteria bacterium]
MSKSRLARVADACGLLTATVGLLVVVGWALEIELLKRVLPGFTAMKTNTALGLVLAGVGLWWRQRSVLRVTFGALVALVGALTLCEYLVGLDLGIDQLFVHEIAASADSGLAPGRMAPATALSFLLLGAALVGLGVSGKIGHAAEILALAVTVIGGLSLLAYPTGALYLRQPPGFVSVALHTAAALVLLGVGVVCAAEGPVQGMRFRGTGRALWLGFGVLTCLPATIGIVFSINIQTLAEAIDAQADVARPRREATIELENRLLGYSLAVRLAVAEEAQGAGAAPTHAADLERHLAEYTALAVTDSQRALAAGFASRWRDLRTVGAALLAGEGQPGHEELARFAALRTELEELLEERMRPEAIAAFEARKAITLRDLRSTARLPLLLLVVSVLFALVTSAVASRAVLRQEDGLREQRELLRVTLTSIGDAVVACNMERRVTFLNPVAESLTGWKSDEAYGQPMATVLRFVNERTREQAPDIWEQVLREGRVVALANHTVLLRKDGREIPIEDSAAPITDGLGNVAGAVLVFHDVTERRRADEQLKSNAARLSRSQEVAHLGSWELDLTRDKLTWSDEVYRIFGLQPQQFGATYEAFLDAVHPDDRAAVDAAYSSSVREGRDTYEIEHRVVRKSSGEVRVVHEKCEHFRDGDGRIVRSVGMVHDITERKAAEDELRESDRRKDEFLAMLSHELRNPLTPIRNSLRILERVTPGGDQARRAHAVIDRQVGHLSRLIEDLLDVNRINRGKIRLQRARLDLVELVRKTFEDHRCLLDEREVAVQLPDEPVWIDGDPTRLVQTIGNLIHNAAKFTPANGKVSVSLARVDGRAVLDVTDTGIGMDPQTLNRLFEPFAQAERSLDRSQGGLGLGLALVKGMVELHGGAVSAHSDGPGRGSRLTVSLPVDGRVAGASDAAPAVVRTATGKRVLIIEDNQDAADSLREALELDGHRVVVAYDGATGLAQARRFNPDIVVCDIGLPTGMDGYDVARAFRAEAALKDTFLVAVSGYALPEDVERARAAGFERHLAKPPDLTTLEQVLAEVPTRRVSS